MFRALPVPLRTLACLSVSLATWRLDPDETLKPPHLRLIHLSPS